MASIQNPNFRADGIEIDPRFEDGSNLVLYLRLHFVVTGDDDDAGGDTAQRGLKQRKREPFSLGQPQTRTARQPREKAS